MTSEEIRKIDLTKMTQMELMDFRMQINEEIDAYANREKVKVCKLFKEFEGTKYFIEKKNALHFLQTYWLSDEEELFEDKNKVILEVAYLSAADVENYCQDFKKP